MGLDQYGLKRKQSVNNGIAEEIAYFRKNNALHGWMEDLWISKGRPLNTEEDGTITYAEGDRVFNCVPLELSEDDLIQLGKDAKSHQLPVTEGFFFGPDSSQDARHIDEILNFVDVALKAIQEGYEIAYNSWW